MDFRIIASKNLSNESAIVQNYQKDEHFINYSFGTLGKDGYIIIDFGRELCGKLHIVLNVNEPKTAVRVRLGESVYETCADLGEKGACNVHSLRDNIYNAPSLSDISTSESGFRFARIDYVNGEYGVNISKIYVEEFYNGLEKKGWFRSDDERINEIYAVAERTISLCVRKNDIWDGIKRDRLLWIGDLYPEMLAAFYVYGVVPQFEKAINVFANERKSWINKIPSYSAWWIICLAKYYEISKNTEFVKKHIEQVRFITESFSAIVSANGEIDYSESRLEYFNDNEFFVDWPTNYTPDSRAGFAYVLTFAMKKAIELFSLCGESGTEAKSVISRLQKHEYEESPFKQITALGMMAGAIPTERGKRMLEENTLSGMTCFMGFAITDALCLANNGELAFDIIKEYYGAMIDMGATTFWEDFDVSWLKDNPDKITEMPNEKKKNIHADYGKFCYERLRMSLCHGWSAGFIEFFYKYVLGIVPVSAGYDEIKIEPHLCGLKYAEGEIPTIHGNIKIKHTVENGIVKTELSLPNGIKAV